MSSSKVERRFVQAELRADSQGDEMSVMGYASVFGVSSEDLGGFREMVMPGAFARSLRESAPVSCLLNHDPNNVLGATWNRTLSLEEDGHGLKFRCTLPPTQTGRDVHALVKRGDLRSCSFAFVAKSQEWSDARSENGDLYASRKLMDVDLADVSIVLTPAYPSTEVNARALFPDGQPMEVRSHIESVGKRGSEAQPPEPYSISLPQPFDSDMKQEWWNAFMDEYKTIIKRPGREVKGQEAISMAAAAANLKVQPQTEVDAEVKGQAPDRTKLPHEVVDTDKGTDETPPVRPAENEDQNRASERSPEGRVYTSVDQVPDKVPAKYKKQWMDIWNSAYKKAKADGKSDADAESSAFAQAHGVINKEKGKESNARTTQDENDNEIDTIKPGDSMGEQPNGDEEDPNQPEDVQDPDDPDWGEEGEEREGKKTKRVGGKDLTADKFAYVGDPEKVGTWKLPIHDEDHARNALARFNQTKGIPADKKEGVWRKVVAAAKKFGIHVSEQDSIRAAVSHDITRAEMGDENLDAVLLALRQRHRLIEIELDL